MPDNFNLDPNQNPLLSSPAVTTPKKSQEGIDINEEITSLEFTPPPDNKAKKIKIVGGVLGLLFILITVPAAVYLSLQAQKVRKEAEEPYCDKNGASCTEDKTCCSGVCSFGFCRGDTNEQGCAGFGEPECWTHVNCYWFNGNCQPRPPGSPPPGVQVNCRADATGVGLSTDSETPITVNVSWFSSKCGNTTDCLCGGASKSETVTISKNQPFSRGITGAGCAWQSDLTSDVGSCSGAGCLPCETPAATPTPPPPSFTMACTTLKAYNTDWSPIADLNRLAVGQTVYFAANGTTNEPGGLTRARFRINSGSWQETTDKHNSDFYIQYTIPMAGSYTVEAMVFNPGLGWK